MHEYDRIPCDLAIKNGNKSICCRWKYTYPFSDPTIPFLYLSPPGTRVHSHQTTCKRMRTAAQLTIAPNWTKMSINSRLDHVWLRLPRMLSSREGRSTTHTTTWMNLTNRTWSKRGKKETFCAVQFHLQEVQKQAQLIPGWWKAGHRLSGKGVLTGRGQEKLPKCGKCPVSWSASWVQSCVHFLKMCGVSHIWLALFPVCMWYIKRRKKGKRRQIYIYWRGTWEDVPASAQRGQVRPCSIVIPVMLSCRSRALRTYLKRRSLQETVLVEVNGAYLGVGVWVLFSFDCFILLYLFAFVSSICITLSSENGFYF